MEKKFPDFLPSGCVRFFPVPPSNFLIYVDNLFATSARWAPKRNAKHLTAQKEEEKSIKII